MRMGFGVWSKVNLSVCFLGCILLLIGAYRAGGVFHPKQRTTTLAALLGLSWVGLDAYGHSHFGLLLALSAVNVFHFGTSLLAGICAAMLISIVSALSPKTVLKLSGILFVLLIALNAYVIGPYYPGRFGLAIRLFSVTTGLSIGMAIPPAIALWLAYKKSRGRINQADGPGLSGA